MKTKSKVFLFVLALNFFEPFANANDIFVKECHGQIQKSASLNTYFAIKFLAGKIGLGQPLAFKDGNGKVGIYVITNVYAASFLDRSFELGYRGGYSHGEIRLTQDYLHNGPLRMQKFDGNETLEGILECK